MGNTTSTYRLTSRGHEVGLVIHKDGLSWAELYSIAWTKAHGWRVMSGNPDHRTWRSVQILRGE